MTISGTGVVDPGGMPGLAPVYRTPLIVSLLYECDIRPLKTETFWVILSGFNRL